MDRLLASRCLWSTALWTMVKQDQKGHLQLEDLCCVLLLAEAGAGVGAGPWLTGTALWRAVHSFWTFGCGRYFRCSRQRMLRVEESGGNNVAGAAVWTPTQPLGVTSSGPHHSSQGRHSRSDD